MNIMVKKIPVPEEYVNSGHDFGFTGIEAVPASHHAETKAQARLDLRDLSSDIRELEKIIVPLLSNLIKTADNDYIHWPNRATICQDYLDKVLAITRKSDE
mgnify:FL=1